MSETLTKTRETHAPQVTYLRDYQAPLYLIDDVQLEFDLTKAHTTVKSLLHIRRNRHTTDTGNTLKLNGEELELISLKINNQPVPATQYQQANNFLTIENVPDTFDLEIVTRIYPDKNTALSGLYISNNTYCTQCEPEGFRRITYFADHPDILSRYITTIIADKEQYPVLLSNGNLIDSGSLPDGRHFAKWEDPFKKPSYLFAMVAGDFDLLEDHFVTQSGRDVLLRIYTDKGFGDASHHAMYSLQEAMRWDEQAYGREYDLDIYMIVAIGDFNMGAMENKGLNIFNTKYVLAKPETATDDDYIHVLSVIGHEYFHNWSGNRVTCRDWFQLSLKEGLTIFRDQSFSEDALSKAVMRIHEVNRLREVQFAEDAGPLSHPVRPDSYIEINNFYTATIYEKGSEVLRMMQTILGPVLFRKGMDLYFAKFDGQAVTIEDFVAVMEDISGIDLKQFRLWYTQAGTPVVNVKGAYDARKKTYTLEMSQATQPTPGQSEKKSLYIPIRMGLLDQEGNVLELKLNGEGEEGERVLFLNEAKQTFAFTDIERAPIPSLLRHFSAPVKLVFPYTNEELLFLFKHDKDAFNRWDAGQNYLLRLMLDMVKRRANGESLSLPTEFVQCFKYILNERTDDAFLLSEMLMFPSEKYIAEQMTVVDVDGIHAVRQFLIAELAKQLESELLAQYNKCNQAISSDQFDMRHVGMRALKNRCLAYLMYLPAHTELGFKQFKNAIGKNMTDTQAALVALSQTDSPLRQQALDEFYKTFASDPLVVDKWFAIQAGSMRESALADVKALCEHPVFDFKNPNKVYALIGTFAYRNASHFHARSGDGYRFLREVVSKLDLLNPSVAGRMVNPLTSWKRYDKERQQLMRAELTVLGGQHKISPDLYEIVTKSLK